MSVRILRASFLVLLAAMPVVVLACGDDEATAPSSTTTVVPDAAAVPPDAVAEAATVAPIVVSLPALAAVQTAYVVFYPKESPDAPVTVPLTSTGPQTITKVMPQGADVVVVVPVPVGTSVVQFDDVGSGESVYLGRNGTDTSSSIEILRHVPAFADAGSDDYVFSSCADTVRAVPANVTSDVPTPGLCRGADGNTRFVATTTSPLLAISTLVSSLVSDDGNHPRVTMPAWTTPAPIAWSFTGAPPVGATVDAKVFATSTGQYGGFELGRFAAVAQGSSFSFVRPPTSFADTELHVVTGQYPPVAAYSSKVVSLERTAASNPVTTDLGAVQTHLTGVSMSATSSGTFGLDFTSSAPIPSGTPIISSVSGSPGGQADISTTSWLTFSSMSGTGHMEARVLPAQVRANVYVANVDWVPQGIYALAGVDPKLVRPNAVAIYSEVTSSDPRGDGFSPGPFSATVSSLARGAH